jgi:glucose-6-phosphate dehydrogenase assembly protein OpcA
MMASQEAMTIEHGTPKKVELSQIEEELEVLLNEVDEAEGTRRTFARALTLAIFCESADVPEVMDELVGHIITRYSARAIVIRTEPGAERGGTEAWIRTHCLTRGDRVTQLCAEQITLHAHGDSIRQVHNSVLELRLGNLPLVVWWRGQPEMENPLFQELLNSGDQIILDSARFTHPTAQLGSLVSRLSPDFERVPFGDINWARLMPWRELIAQFFDSPEQLKYLKQLGEVDLEYSAGGGGNPAQAILLTMWLATMLNWQVVADSWQTEGRGRSLRLRDAEREIRVQVRASEDPQTRPGWLDSVTLRAPTDPPATFQITSCGEDCAKTLIRIGEREVERMVSLAVPDEVELVCSEFDASQRDRVYHHALQVLEHLLV